MNFPHLSDTQFPNLSTVNVYQFQNKFDYSRWNEKTKVRLVNVPWNSSYSDVVKFDTDVLRDRWFDSIDDFWVVELRTSARVVPEGFVKLPIPYDVMARYNYLYIDMPIATSATNQLDYENSEGIRRWYFFINDIQYLSPNATQVSVAPDVWTNFQNAIDINYMLLERGHAPVAYSDVDQYLADPISNNKYLLAPDVNFDNAGITKSSTFIPFGNGTKYMCFATTVNPSAISTLGEVTADSSYNPTGTITYSNTSARYGYQLQVNGLTIGNGRNYSNARTPARAGISYNGYIPNNLSVYAIEAEAVYGSGSTFFEDIINKCPQFLTTVQACFVVDEACLTFGTTYVTIAGYSFRRCKGKTPTTLLSKALTKAEFNYPSKYQKYAKLYTAPYAQLEITDNDGNTFEVNIEETTTLNVKYVVSVAFPYINERVYVQGIGGKGSNSYTWVDLKNSSANLNMPNCDWFKYCFDWNIPTFALYMNGETAFQLETFNRNVKQAIQQSLVNYHNSMRSSNTAYENACDQADVAYTNTTNAANTARTNSYNSADTGKVNADNSADTMKTNADMMADIAYTNVDRSCTTQSTNLATDNARIADNEEDGIDSSTSQQSWDNRLTQTTAAWANAVVSVATSIDVERSTSASLMAATGHVVGSVAEGAASGMLFGAAGGTAVLPGVGTVSGAAAMAVGGAIMGGISGAADYAAAKVTATTNTNLAAQEAQNQQLANSSLADASVQTAQYIQAYKNSLRRYVYARNARTSVAIQNNSNLCSRTNASDTRDGTKTSATNNRNTQKTNATNTKNTSKTNANNTYVVTEANADRTRDNVKANAGYTRQVATLNAKEILENGKYAAMAAIYDARNAAPVECCPYSGNPGPDYMRTRGIQIKVKTQSDSAISQTGDIFVRYGYTLNQIWDVNTTGLNLMQHFTYWKAAEIWVNGRGDSNNIINSFIQNLFLRGITVWKKPEEIGNIDVYTN